MARKSGVHDVIEKFHELCIIKGTATLRFFGDTARRVVVFCLRREIPLSLLKKPLSVKIKVYTTSGLARAGREPWVISDRHSICRQPLQRLAATGEHPNTIQANWGTCSPS
jgi:hypothetical protein